MNNLTKIKNWLSGRKGSKLDNISVDVDKFCCTYSTNKTKIDYKKGCSLASICALLILMSTPSTVHALEANAATKACQFDNVAGVTSDTTDPSLANNEDITGNNGATCAAPTVTITEDADNDGIISAAELSGDIDVSVALPTSAVEGDTITVTDGTTSTAIVLTATDITNGTVTTTFANPGDASSISVTATLTDVLGNVSENSAPDSAVLDITAPKRSP